MELFLRSLATEARFCRQSLLFLWLLVVAPFAGSFVLDGLFGEGLMRELPSVVVDQDRSCVSRELVRRIEALPSLKVSFRCATPEEGYARVLEGDAFCLFVVPRNFERDLLKGRSPRLEAWVDGQHMAAGTLLRRDLTELGADFWSGFYANFLVGSGCTPDAALNLSEPVGIDLRSISNPAANYRTYMPHAFFPVLWQLVLLVWLCFRLHAARRDGALSLPSLLGRMVPGAVWAWGCCCATGALLAVRGQIVFAGGLASLFFVYLLVLLAVSGLALLLAGLGDELLQSLVLASGLASPAFAFSGVSFPLASMPLFARLWASMIPLSHGMTLEVFLAQMGAPIVSQWREIAALLLQALLYGGVGLLFHRIRHARCARSGPKAKGEPKVLAAGPCVQVSPPDFSSRSPLSFASAFLEELRSFCSNKGALSIFIVGVAFYAVLYPIPYANQVPQKLPVAVVDEDGGSLGRAFVRMAGAGEGVEIAARYASPAPALDSLRKGEVFGVLCIPEDFGRNLLKGEKAPVPFYCDAAHLLPYGKALEGIRQAAEALGAGIRLTRLEKGGMTRAAAASLQTRGRPNATLLYNPAGNYALNTVLPVLVIILQQTLLLGSAMLAASAAKRDAAGMRSGLREGGNLSLPALFGRLLFPVLVYLGYACLYFRVLPLFCDLPVPRDFGAFLLFLFPFLLACAAMGHAIGLLVRDSCRIMAAVLPTSLPFLFLSGFVWPRQCMPGFFAAAGCVLPDVPAIDGSMLLLLRGAKLAQALPQWIHLWGLAAAWIGVLLLLSRKRAEDGKALHGRGA